MKKLSNYLVFALVCAGLVMFNSCEKEDGLSEIDIENQVKIENEPGDEMSFFIDDLEVQAHDFEISTSNMILVEVIQKTDNLKSNDVVPDVEKRAYSSEENYIAYGKANGLKLEELLSFEKIMSSFAEASGAIDEFEKSNVMPQWYLEREAFVYDSIFYNVSNFKSSLTLFTTFYDNPYVPGQNPGPCIIMPKFLPFMPPGWNDRVSCVELVGIGGGIIIYGKSFYRNKLITIIDWASQRINLGYGVNDAMRSGMEIF
jgi:hypothetical protein